jgi:hypothetical protein
VWALGDFILQNSQLWSRSKYPYHDLPTFFKILSPLMSVGLHVTLPAKCVIISLFVFLFKKFPFSKYPTL